MGVFVYNLYPFVQISHPHSWIKIIYKSTHDITSMYAVPQQQFRNKTTPLPLSNLWLNWKQMSTIISLLVAILIIISFVNCIHPNIYIYIQYDRWIYKLNCLAIKHQFKTLWKRWNYLKITLKLEIMLPATPIYTSNILHEYIQIHGENSGITFKKIQMGKKFTQPQLRWN